MIHIPLESIFVRILEILLVPYYYNSVLWTIAPLFFALIMIQMYFGKYKTEPLGWNTAYGNTISLMWVTAILLRYMHENYGLATIWTIPRLTAYMAIIEVLVIITIALAFLNFTHKMPKKLAFLVSSSLPIISIAYFSIVIIMGKIPIDTTTFWAVITIAIFLTIIFNIYRHVITPSESAKKILKKHKEERQKQIKKIKQKIKKGLSKLQKQPKKGRRR